jgi:Zn-dependent peptidase ImmA (M78 family)
MTPQYALAKRKARDLLEKAGINRAPVQVEKLAEIVGARVEYEAYDGELSGMLLRRGKEAVIGVNLRHSPTRQRFSIAHEIGHMLLHKTETFHLAERHQVKFRDLRSATGQDSDEIEANQFAAELLMPEEFLARDIVEYFGDDPEIAVAGLAKKYQVSEQAMAIRLGALGYVR